MEEKKIIGKKIPPGVVIQEITNLMREKDEKNKQLIREKEKSEQAIGTLFEEQDGNAHEDVDKKQ